MTAPELIIVGYQAKLRDDVWSCLPKPKPPRSYTKPETIEKWEREQLPALLTSAECQLRSSRLFAAPLRIVAVNASRGKDCTPLDTQADADTNPAMQFVAWLADQQFQFSEYPAGDTRTAAPPCAFYGFDVKPLLRMLGCEAARHGVKIPLGLWYGYRECFSPYEMICEADSSRKAVSQQQFARVLTRLGLVPERLRGVPDLDQYAPHADPLADTLLTAELVNRFGLYPLDGLNMATMPAAAGLEPEVAVETPKPKTRRKKVVEPT